jgi:LEA14-like dessication related protein
MLVVMALVAAVLSALTGYRFFSAVESVGRMATEIEGVSLERNRLGARLSLALRIAKPDSGPVTVSQIMYSVSLNGQVIGSSRTNLGYRTLETEPIRTVLSLQLGHEALGQFEAAERTGEATWQILGTLRVGTEGLEFWVPIGAQRLQAVP